MRFDKIWFQIQHLLKLNFRDRYRVKRKNNFQIQHLLKLNAIKKLLSTINPISNTTLVKVKWNMSGAQNYGWGYFKYNTL